MALLQKENEQLRTRYQEAENTLAELGAKLDQTLKENLEMQRLGTKYVETATAFKELELKLDECRKARVTSRDTCNLSTNLEHLQTKEADYPRQKVYGPMQADEMLSVFSIIRTSFVRRVLEIGGFKGDSAWNFLEALRCKSDAAVYTVDLNPVKRWEDHPVPHKTMVKDASSLTFEDIDGEPLDALLLDCHAFTSTQKVVRHILKNKFLSPNGFILLHDTGLHPSPSPSANPERINVDPPGLPHQPVERLIAQWIQHEDCSFQRISLHDDQRVPFRHGLTIMQRRVNLDVNNCARGLHKYADYEPQACEAIQKITRKLNTTCPVVS